MNGPTKWMKRIWNHKLRQKIRKLLRKDQDAVTYPKKGGNDREWY